MPWYPGKTDLDSAQECAQSMAETAGDIVAALQAGDVHRAAHIEVERMSIWRHRWLEYLSKIRGTMLCQLCHTIGHTAPGCPKLHQGQPTSREQRLAAAPHPQERQ